MSEKLNSTDFKESIKNLFRPPFTKIIEIPDSYRYKEKKEWYYFNSYGITMVPEKEGVTDVGIFHFTPNSIRNIDDVNKDERFTTAKDNLRHLIRGMEMFELFVKDNPNTHLAKVTQFQGLTNKTFAQFLNKYFGMEITELEPTDYNSDEYFVKIDTNLLLENIKNFRNKNSKFIEYLNSKI